MIRFPMCAGITVAGCLGLLLAVGCKSSSTGGNSDDGGGGGDIAIARAKSISKNNLKQLVIAMHNYESAHGHLPSPGIPVDPKKGPMMPLPNLDAQYSWRVHVLPFLEQVQLFNQIDTFKGGPIPDQVANTAIKIYSNPMDKTPSNLTPYRVFVGGGAFFDRQFPITFHGVTDGTANTIMIVEAAESVPWSSTNELEYDPNKPLPKLGIFPGGFHAAMADGTIVWIPDTTPEKTIKAMITRAGGEAFEFPKR